MNNLQKGKIFRILLTTLFILSGCSDSSDPELLEPDPNQAPVANNIVFLNTILLNSNLDYDASYSIRCNAEDADGDSLSYTWIFIYRDFHPFIWGTFNDTLISAASVITWTSRGVGDLDITCLVEDEMGQTAEITRTYFVRPPEELTQNGWKLDMILGVEDTAAYMVQDNYYLNIDEDAYYGRLGLCDYRFGQIALINDTLAFDLEFNEPLPETCSDDSSDVYWAWTFLEILSYRYEVYGDTLDLLFPDDTLNFFIYRFLSVPTDDLNRIP